MPRLSSDVVFRGGISPAIAASELGNDDVHIWRLAIPEGAVLAPLPVALDEEERRRAGRFVRAGDRVRFAAAHAALRHVLAAYAGVPAAELRFDVGQHGKPFLCAPSASPPPVFNLSHSGPWVLIAVARAGDLGVDVEAHRDISERDAVARRVFAQEELKQMRRLSEPAASATFFRIWSAKEAFIKAIGLGIFQDLAGFAVDPDERGPRLLRTPGEFAPAGAWRLWWLDVDRAAAACCAWRGDGHTEVQPHGYDVAWDWIAGA